MWVVVIAVGLIGSIYAIWGGLKSCAVSDTLNGIGLLVGGFLITYFAFRVLGDGSFAEGVSIFGKEASEAHRLNSIGANDAEAPFTSLFTGILIINAFYWCTNQQIIQRTFGAKGLAEGQKGVLLTAGLKLIGPLYLVLPGLIAAVMVTKGIMTIPADPDSLNYSDFAYGTLVSFVLPKWLTGFFAAVLLGAILSSFNSALNSTCTIFSLGIYKRLINPEASDKRVVYIGRIFGCILAAAAVIVAPLLSSTGGIFSYLQKMNAIYFIPIFSVVLMGMLSTKVPPAAAKFGLIGGVVLIALGYFVPPFNIVTDSARLGFKGEYHFVAAVFVLLMVVMYVIGRICPRETIVPDAKATDMTPWKHAT